MGVIRSFRWWVAGLLAAATAINYLDRQTLPVVVTELQHSITISDQQYSVLQGLFLIAYGLMYAGGGRIVDLLGTRFGYALMVAWWSLANCLHGLVSGFAGLATSRVLLGLGEGGGFPASGKAVSEWFPPEERSFAFGIFNTGSSLGAVVAPPLVAAILVAFGWRAVFFITGGLGLIWVGMWLWWYDVPTSSSRVTEEERALVLGSRDVVSTQPAIGDQPVLRWTELFRYRQLWGLLVARFCSEGAWYFFIFWLPKYLSDARSLDIRAIGAYAWIPYACAGAGSFVGGWLSSVLIRRRLSLDASRKIALGLSAALMPVSLLISSAPLTLVLALFGLAMFGHQFWSTILQTLCADMFPSSVVGSVIGLAGAVGTFSAALFQFLVGYLVSSLGYAPVFVLAGLLHPASFVLILLIIRRIDMVQPGRGA